MVDNVTHSPARPDSDVRFEFGRNWTNFLAVLDDERIMEAEKSLRGMLGLTSLAGKTFLDVGSGSGLFSLAGRRMDARVRSFDYDKNSVACTRELRRRHFPDDAQWQIDQGSVLDEAYLTTLGRFDIVYSWGVLHHTGEMWRALDNASGLVEADGQLYIAIYNDQGVKSRFWRAVKKAYCSNPINRIFVMVCLLPYLALKDGLRGAIKARGNVLAGYRSYRQARGMSYWYDWIDWLGGYPFEVAKPEAIFDFLRSKGFELVRMRTCGGGWGCNEFVFRRSAAD